MSSKGIPLSQSKFFQRAKTNTSVRAPPTPSEPSAITPPIVGNAAALSTAPIKATPAPTEARRSVLNVNAAPFVPSSQPPKTTPKQRTPQDLLNTLSKQETRSFLPKTAKQDPEWYPRLVRYLNQLLSPISTQEELRVLTDPKQERRWRINFTHSSSNFNKGENYEIMEKLGDGVMRLSFIKYLLQKYPQLDESDISNLSAHYLSKPNQAPIAMALGLHKFLIIEINIDTGIYEDLLEAFFGTLFTILNNEYQDGAGVAYEYARRFLEYIYENKYPIDLSNRYGHPKSQVTQSIRGMQWGNLLEKNAKGELKYVVITETVADVQTTLYFPDEAMRYFKNRGITVSRILGSGKGNTKKVASDAAYAQALKLLSNLQGVDYIALSRQDKLINNPEISDLYKRALSLAKGQGYETIRVVNLKSYRNKEALSLQGVDKEGQSHLLIWAEGPNHTDVQKELLRGYIENYS